MPTPFQTLHKRWREEAEAGKSSVMRRERRMVTSPPQAIDNPGAVKEPAPTGEEDAS